MGTITTPGIGGGGGGRVFSTTNGGTWNEAGASPLPDSNRVEIAVSSSNANKMYALTQGAGSSTITYLYRRPMALIVFLMVGYQMMLIMGFRRMIFVEVKHFMI